MVATDLAAVMSSACSWGERPGLEEIAARFLAAEMTIVRPCGKRVHPINTGLELGRAKGGQKGWKVLMRISLEMIEKEMLSVALTVVLEVGKSTGKFK